MCAQPPDQALLDEVNTAVAAAAATTEAAAAAEPGAAEEEHGDVPESLTGEAAAVPAPSLYVSGDALRRAVRRVRGTAAAATAAA